MREKVDYYKCIWEYKKRLKEMDDAHKAKRKTLLDKIRIYRKGHERATGRNVALQTIKAIQSATEEYFELDLAVKTHGGETGLARKFYYKYCLEEGFSGRKVSDAVNKSDNSALNGRASLTKMLGVDGELSAKYQRYKAHMDLKMNKNQLKKAA